MVTYHHVYTSKTHVLCEINSKLLELGDWKNLDILIFQHKGDNETIVPQSLENLIEILKDIDSVYSFHRVETKKHGAIGYDIIINE